MSRPQSVLDALADAETLRRYLRSTMTPFAWRFESGLCYRYPRKGDLDPIGAIHKARAAFRAVPALRGEA